MCAQHWLVSGSPRKVPYGNWHLPFWPYQPVFVPVSEECTETYKTEHVYQEDQHVQAKQDVHVFLFLDLGVESLGTLETL